MRTREFMRKPRIKKLKIISGLIFTAFIAINLLFLLDGLFLTAHAETKYTIDYPGKTESQSETPPMSGFVGAFYTFALGAVGVAALGPLTYGGILWTDNQSYILFPH